MSKSLDLNIIAVKNGRLCCATKGAKETSNIIIQTYKNHRQLYECLVSEAEEIDLIDRLKPVCKYILDNEITFMR